MNGHAPTRTDNVETTVPGIPYQRFFRFGTDAEGCVRFFFAWIRSKGKGRHKQDDARHGHQVSQRHSHMKAFLANGA